jgi:hypothetical protein
LDRCQGREGKVDANAGRQRRNAENLRKNPKIGRVCRIELAKVVDYRSNIVEISALKIGADVELDLLTEQHKPIERIT